jgi:hypothetical protein
MKPSSSGGQINQKNFDPPRFPLWNMTPTKADLSVGLSVFRRDYLLISIDG